MTTDEDEGDGPDRDDKGRSLTIDGASDVAVGVTVVGSDSDGNDDEEMELEWPDALAAAVCAMDCISV